MAVPTPDPLGQGMFHGFALHWGRVQLRQKTRLHAQEENSKKTDLARLIRYLLYGKKQEQFKIHLMQLVCTY